MACWKITHLLRCISVCRCPFSSGISQPCLMTPESINQYCIIYHYIIYPIIMPLIFHEISAYIPNSLPFFLVGYCQSPSITTIPALVSCKKLLLTSFNLFSNFQPCKICKSFFGRKKGQPLSPFHRDSRETELYWHLPGCRANRLERWAVAVGPDRSEWTVDRETGRNFVEGTPLADGSPRKPYPAWST